MKTSSLVLSYFQKKTDKLLLSFEKPAESFSAHDFHLIRVEIKRIKAVLTFLEEAYPPFHRKKYYAPFKIIFRQAGKIRDLQLQMTMVNSNPLNTAIEKFEHEIAKQILDEKMKFYKLITPSLIKDLCRKTSKTMDSLDQIDNKKARSILKKKENSIKQLLSPAHLKPSGNHELRKRIKELYYLQKMLEPKINWLVDTEQLQDVLGKWHDGRILLKGLKTFMKSGALNQEDIFNFEALKTKISSVDQELYQTILRDKTAIIKAFT